MNSLPRYSISINPEHSENGEDLGMTAIAYTANPAIIQRGMAFNSKLKMQFADQLKGRLAAPILIPDFPIYREDDELGAYEVVFSKETIEALYDKFMANKDKNIFNLDHNNEMKSPAFIRESWVTGPSATDPSFTKYGIELPEGSVFVVSQFTDMDYFKKEIIEKDRLGYSIEGFLGLALNTIKQKLTQNKMKQKFEKAILEDGTALFISKMEVGGEVFVIDDNGDKAPVFDGEHKLQDGSGLVTVDGKITEIKPKVEEAMVEEVAVVAEEVTALAEEPIVEVAPVVEAPASIMDEAAILAIVQPKFDEIYKVIAEIKTLIEAEQADEIVEEVMSTKSSEFKFRHLFK